jgi:iron complex outermembrane receptor protein
MRKNPSHFRVVLVVACLSAAHGSLAADSPDLTTLSLEDLAKLEVTSASRKAQPLADTAAAIFVITAEDIARSTATTIPDLLRTVPGLEVAELGTSRWAVTSRGFNSRFADKLLVLLDGRTLDSPLFSGVLWENQDIPLEDIERIEVVRGPGGSMWGSNAVTGVINIITKSADKTQGGLASAVVGTQDNTLGTVQYGGPAGDSGSYRIYARQRNWDVSHDPTGLQDNDKWNAQRLGLRVDLQPTAQDHLTGTADYYSSKAGDVWLFPQVQAPYSVPTVVTDSGEGFNMLGRWERTREDGSATSVQASLEHSNLSTTYVIGETRDTVELSGEHRLKLGSSHDVVMGLAYFGSHDDTDSSALLGISPSAETYQREGAFLQDEITLIPSTLRVSLGSRFEYNSISGYTSQPNARLLWKPAPNQTVWAAASHATETTSRAEADGTIDLAVIPPGGPGNPSALPMLLQSRPADRRSFEEVDAYEIGYRTQIATQASLDVAAFHNRHRDLGTNGPTTTTPVAGPPPYLLTQIQTANDETAHSDGVEVAIDWRPLTMWRLQASYTYLYVEASSVPDDTTPRSQFSVVSQVQIAPKLQFDLRYRTVGQVGFGSIPAYDALDARLGWQATKNLDLSLIGTNLLHRYHPEAVTDVVNAIPRDIDRSVFLKATLRF